MIHWRLVCLLCGYDACFDKKRFLMYLISDNEYLIIDHEHDSKERTIDAELLHNPEFMPVTSEYDEWIRDILRLLTLDRLEIPGGRKHPRSL
jgi:hypothetical protein